MLEQSSPDSTVKPSWQPDTTPVWVGPADVVVVAEAVVVVVVVVDIAELTPIQTAR
jgi:hypothetical protein